MTPSAAQPTRRTTPAKCRSCNRPMDSPLFCSNCRSLHPPDGFTHFELLGLPPAYQIDEPELRRKYLQCSREVHPDHHGGGDEAASSLSASARLNEAYRVLADPLLRAEYVLELSGGKSSAQDKSVPQEVLTQTLMLREEIEQARAAGDQTALANYRRQVSRLHDQALTGIAGLARQLPGTDDIRRQLRQKLNTVKYYQKLLEQL